MTVLNYRPSTSAVYYTPPTRFDFRRTAFGLLIAATLAALGAIGYAEIQPNLQSPYLRVGGVAVASGATALLALIPTRYGRVRIRMLAAFLGATLGLFTLYVHLSKLETRRGAIVEKGQEIGKVGATGRATGPHLHFAARLGEARIDPQTLLERNLD